MHPYNSAVQLQMRSSLLTSAKIHWSFGSYSGQQTWNCWPYRPGIHHIWCLNLTTPNLTYPARILGTRAWCHQYPCSCLPFWCRWNANTVAEFPNLIAEWKLPVHIVKQSAGIKLKDIVSPTEWVLQKLALEEQAAWRPSYHLLVDTTISCLCQPLSNLVVDSHWTHDVIITSL